MEIEELKKDKTKLALEIESKVNELQDKYKIELSVIVFNDAETLIGRDYQSKICSIKVEL